MTGLIHAMQSGMVRGFWAVAVVGAIVWTLDRIGRWWQ